MGRSISRLILTASEGVCNALEHKLNGKPGIVDTFQDSGYWYSNGETGPEWFTLTIEADYSNKELIESLVDEALEELGTSVNNRFWG